MNVKMYQGTLEKWTNYFQGWQPRWFVLESGILSYYLSQEEVKNGSRGSFKVAMCTIQSDPYDARKIVVTSKSGEELYVKTSTPEDCQKWLVELAKAKQSEGSRMVSKQSEGFRMMEQTDGDDMEEHIKQNMAALRQTCNLLVEQITVVKETCSKTASIDVQLLERKCGEIQETCDVFLGKLGNCMKVEEYMQRFVPLKRVKSNSKSEDGQSRTTTGHAVPKDIFYPLNSTPGTPTSPHTMSLPVLLGKGSTSSPKQSPKLLPKSSVSILPRHQDGHAQGQQNDQTPGHQDGRTPGQQHDRNSHEQDVRTPGYQDGHPSPGLRHGGVPAHLKAHSTNPSYGSDRLSEATPSHSMDSLVLGENEVTAGSFGNSPSTSQNNRSQDTSGRYGYNRSGSEAFITPVSSPKESSSGTPTDEDDSKEETPFQDTTEETTTNFLILEYKFDFSLTPEGEIPTEAYLKASKGLLTFLDSLNSTTIAPVRADVAGNIAKLVNKYESNPTGLATLQSMVKLELDSGTHLNSGSSTDALLWLRRTLDFASAFAAEVATGEPDLIVSAGKAYTDTLRQHHNWIVRGLFSVACQVLPYRRDFILTLAGKQDVDEEEYAKFEALFCKELSTWSTGIKEFSKIITTFYSSHGLEET
jgi:pleckstrin family protein A (phosphoinositide binding specific) protein 8